MWISFPAGGRGRLTLVGIVVSSTWPIGFATATRAAIGPHTTGFREYYLHLKDLRSGEQSLVAQPEVAAKVAALLSA